MSLRLRIEHGQDAGKTWRLPQAGVYTVGRVPGNSVRVLDMKVSKRHCEIRVTGGDQAALVDANSTTGCVVNGQPVPKGKGVRLRAGDELRLGLTILRVLSAGEADEDARPVAGRTVDDAAVAGTGRNANAGKTKTTLPADALVGKELSGYTIERKIGAGGMGGVYLAEQTSLQRKVALKVLNETFASDSAFVDQFVNEARAAGALNHPNVVQVYDVGSADGHYYFSMEVMPGGSIEDKIKEGPIAWEDGLNWFLDSANALIFAKRREILHRDVKPDNLMIGEDESAKLCDLGLAKKSEVGDLMDQGIIGTPHFISPEAIRRKGDIDHRTDLYSLGCTFYRVFTGRNPYPGASVKEILLGHLNKPIPRINETNRNVPRELDEVVYQLMRKDPEERIQTPEELLRELDKIRTKYNLEAHGIKPASKKPLIIGGVAAAIAIGIAIWFATRPNPTKETGLTAEQKQAQRDADRALVQTDLERFTSRAKERLGELEIEYVKAEIDEEENWKKPVFPRIGADLRKEAKAWEAQREAWAAQKQEHAEKSEPDEVILGYYDTYRKELAGHIENARKLAQSIDETVEDYRKNEKARNEARANAIARAESDIKGYADKLKKLYDERQFLELERQLHPSVLEKIVADLGALTFGKRQVPLLKPEKEITPRIDKYLPGNKDGTARGLKLLAAAERAIDAQAGQALNAAAQALRGEPDFATFEAAQKALEGFLAAIPAPLDAENAPRVTRAWKRAEDKVKAQIKRIEERRDTFEFKMLQADRETYFAFLVDIWAPRTGLLRRFEFGVARQRAEKLESTLQHGRYKLLARQWPAPLAALETLFADVIAAYPDGWTAKHTFMPDRNGRLKKVTIKKIDAKGFEAGRDEYTFQGLGARGVLEKILFVENGELRLGNPSSTQHLGLALLAELAADYETASSQYMAAKGKADAATQAAIDMRLQRLPKERIAADHYRRLVAFIRETERWAREKEARIAADRAEPGTMTPEERAAIKNPGGEGERIMRDLQSFQALKDELREKPALAGTVWGSSLRDSPHPEVAYAGERLEPPKPPKPPRTPKKGK